MIIIENYTHLSNLLFNTDFGNDKKTKFRGK